MEAIVDISDDEEMTRNETMQHSAMAAFGRPKTRSQDASIVAASQARAPSTDDTPSLRKGLEQLKVTDLKELLRSHGLKAAGNKAALVDALANAGIAGSIQEQSAGRAQRVRRKADDQMIDEAVQFMKKPRGRFAMS